MRKQQPINVLHPPYPHTMQILTSDIWTAKEGQGSAPRISKGLSHEFTFWKRLPPLVLAAIGQVQNLEYAKANFLSALLDVGSKSFRLGRRLGRRVHAPQLPARLSWNCKSLDGYLMYHLLCITLSRNSFQFLETLAYVKRQVNQRPVRTTFDLKVPKENIRSEKLNSLVDDVFVLFSLATVSISRKEQVNVERIRWQTGCESVIPGAKGGAGPRTLVLMPRSAQPHSSWGAGERELYLLW